MALLMARYDTGQPGGLAMIGTVKARYTNGVFTPIEPVDLEEGTEVTVSMGGEPHEHSETAQGSEPSLLHLIEELHASDLAREPGSRPVDLAEHYKHYLYGHPKGEER